MVQACGAILVPRISHPSQHVQDSATHGCLDYDGPLHLQQIYSGSSSPGCKPPMRALTPNGLSSAASTICASLTLITPMRRRDQSQYYMPIRQFYECKKRITRQPQPSSYPPAPPRLAPCKR